MTIKQILLAGAALSISLSPALAAKAPPMSVVAMHPGNAVVKTQMHAPKATNVTYTFTVSTGVSTATAYKKKTQLAATYYTWQSNGSICQPGTHQKVVLSTKKTKYAQLSTGVETISEGCGTPTTFYGDVYDLQTKKAKKPDTFTSTLLGDFTNSGTKYKGKLNLDVSVTISK